MSKKSKIIILDRVGPMQKRDSDHSGVEVYAMLDQDRIISAGTDNCIRVWNWNTGVEEKLLFSDSHHAIQCMAVSHNKTRLATGHGSWGGVHVWDLVSGDLVSCLEDEMYISSVAFSEDDSLVFMHHAHNQVVTLNADTCEVRHVVNKDQGSGALSVFSQDGSILYYFDAKSVYAMESATGKEIWQTVIAGDRCFVLSPDGDRLALLDQDHKIRILRSRDGATGPILNTDYDFMGPYDDIALAFTVDGEHIVMACGEFFIQLWHIASGELCCQAAIKEETHFKDLMVLPDNKRFVFGDWHGNNYLGELKITPSETDNEINWIIRAPDEFMLFRRQYSLAKNGYYWESDKFIQKLSETAVDELVACAQLLMSPEAKLETLTVGLLAGIQTRLQKLDAGNPVIVDILIDILQQATASAGVALHDSHGMMDSYATDSAKTISQFDHSQLSKNQWDRLLQVYQQVKVFEEELEQIGVSFKSLNDFISRREQPGKVGD